MFTIFAFALFGVVAVAIIGCVGGGTGGSESETRERRERMLSARGAAEKTKDAVLSGAPSATAVDGQPALDGARRTA